MSGERAQSERAPTNAPVGHSVHGMGCIFSSSLNQSTFFWGLVAFFCGGCFFLNPDLDPMVPKPMKPTTGFVKLVPWWVLGHSSLRMVG